MHSKRFSVLAFTLEPLPRKSAMHRQHWLKAGEPVQGSLFVPLANSRRTQNHLTARRYRVVRASRIKAASIKLSRAKRS
jgi:hypothetical protein